MASSSSLPSGTPMGTDPSAVWQRIERNTAETLRWMKILVAAVIVLIVVTVAVLV